MALTGLDYLTLLIMLFFTLLGFVRGFIGELSSLISWVSASIITAIFQQSLSSVIYEKIHSYTISSFLGGGIIFVVSIIMISILTTKIGSKITTKFPYSINATLGIFFGFLKGFLISSLIFLVIMKLFVNDFEELKDSNKPKWLKNAKMYNMLSFGAYLISPINDILFDKMEQQYNNLEDKKHMQNDNNLRRYDEQNNFDEEEREKNNEEENNPGYEKEQIEKLNYLIENL